MRRTVPPSAVIEEQIDGLLAVGVGEDPRESLSGLRNGFRPRKLQTLDGELEVEIPQVREADEPFVSKLFPCSTKVLRTAPLRAMVVGAFVRGLSMRDIESLCEKAGLGTAVEDDRPADLQ